MADSDEEYERRRVRDKFRRERSDYQERSGNRRDDWSDSRDSSGVWGTNPSSSRDRLANRSSTREYSRDAYGGSTQRRDRYGSPKDRNDLSPPMKRIRNTRDWDERGNFFLQN
jgi:serrate RNA effector molecule homolog